MTRGFALIGVLVATGCAANRDITATRTFPFSADVVYQIAMERFGEAHRIHPHLFHAEYLDGAEEAAVGVRREVWTTEDGERYMQEELLVVDAEARRTQLAIVFAQGIPVNTDESFVESVVTPIDDNSCTWTTSMTLRTRPAALGPFAEGGVKSDMEDMLIGLEHHIATGEDITPELFDVIQDDYR